MINVYMIIGSMLIGAGIGLFIPYFMEFIKQETETKFKHSAKMMTISLLIVAIGLGIQIYILSGR